MKKISQETGRSAERLRFVRGIADKFGIALLSSRKLSNPGHNGFSVTDEDLDRSPDVKDFLEELSDYGNLLVLKHTTKEKDRRCRRKWYLNPILCPNFKLPYKRLKEPRYVSAAEVADWMRKSSRKTSPSSFRSSRRIAHDLGQRIQTVGADRLAAAEVEQRTVAPDRMQFRGGTLAGHPAVRQGSDRWRSVLLHTRSRPAGCTGIRTIDHAKQGRAPLGRLSRGRRPPRRCCFANSTRSRRSSTPA
ncbi:hypothetical protein ACFPFP_38425 [Bradyrhizobium sp. GCM10023182]|uniref:Uncharacterized protein n=1 Tax=Bradyrhizobium zhengyangense TaxID=2911009 RepID=A0ABS9M0K5_9BRAD|nr:hypothetical protein [Bradyrhizobium zhengyangense]MCG2672789.1 hypothetical protein [Bradyrhizobium zhengyangense]